jgi:hypothetical protein
MKGGIQNIGISGSGLRCSSAHDKPWVGWGGGGKRPSIRARQAASIASGRGRKIAPITLPKLHLPPHVEDEDEDED